MNRTDTKAGFRSAMMACINKLLAAGLSWREAARIVLDIVRLVLQLLAKSKKHPASL